MVDAELHRFTFDDGTEIQDRDVEMAVGEINAALAHADLLEAESFLVKVGGFFDVVSSDGDMFDLRHGLVPPRGVSRALKKFSELLGHVQQVSFGIGKLVPSITAGLQQAEHNGVLRFPIW